MIGVFDSGVGGLGVFQAIARLLPYENMVYVAGNAYLPFGEKSPEELCRISEKIVQFLIDKHNVKLVVIACNTATVATIDHLRSVFPIPFVGVVPVVKPACEQTKTGCVAILSTPLTAESQYVKDLIQQFGVGVQVLSIGCPGLADMVEAGMVGSPELEMLLHKLVAPALEQHADIIGLCSTHYPFIREQLQCIVGPLVTILDSHEPVARQVGRVLKEYSLEEPVGGDVRYIFYATKNACQFQAIAQRLIGDIVGDVQEVDLRIFNKSN